MLYSMTGYGRAETTIQDFLVSVDVKSLNGKQFDLNTRMPLSLKPYEIDIKNIVQQKLQRGSVEIFIAMKQHGSNKPMKVNTELAKYYFDAMQQISKEINTPMQNALQVLMSMPEVVSQSTDDIIEDDWKKIENAIVFACDNLMNHRAKEGDMIQAHLTTLVQNIETLNNQVAPLEENRTAKQKQRLLTLLNDNIGEAQVDKNRLEQELIYYLEKLDITEEKTRLTHHCNYFKDAIVESSEQKGKKLGFIMQEIGREINTMGSKANDAELQTIVVKMKDELEKAKEQTLNVL